MLQLFIKDNEIVFQNIDNEFMHHLQWKYGIEFDEEDGEYKIKEKPEWLYKLILKLSYDYDIEIN